MYKCIFRSLDPAVFDCQVQICTYKDLDRVQVDQWIDKSYWGQWDVQTIAEKEAAKYYFDFVSMTSDTDSDSVCSVESVNTIPYDITSDMIIDCDIDLDSMNEQSVNEIPALPDLETLRAELNVIGGNESPQADFVMPDDYYQASPIYSPASPDEQSVSMSPTSSPITISNNTDTEFEDGFSPPQQDGPIIPRGMTYLLYPQMIQTLIWTGM